MPTVHTHIIDKLAVINGFVSGIALYPQIFEIIVRHEPNSLSTLTLALIFCNNIVWAAYAFHRLLISLLIAALLNLLASGILLTI